MEPEPEPTVYKLVMLFCEQMMKIYWGPIWHFVNANPELKETITGFLINPKKLSIYIGRTHIGVEYHGSELNNTINSESNLELYYRDCSGDDGNLLEKIIGFSYDSSVATAKFPLLPFNEDLILPTNRGFDKLHELGWNFAAQNAVIGFNVPTPYAEPKKFVRIVNGFFFDANETGLVTRHIKWLDLIPIVFDGSDENVDSIRFTLEPFVKFVEPDARYRYPLPDDYKYIKLPLINRFIEMWGNSERSEPQITNFLSDEKHRFIITMRFGAVEAHPQLECDWQSEQRKSIIPDYFIEHSNGFADIVEFKLPSIKNGAIVGTSNRETFSSWLNSYISQTRVYSTYFDDPNNRSWFESKYGFKVYRPRRWLVVGRRNNFEPTLWREIISDYKDIDIITYDDLIDGVVAQFYK